MSPLLVKAVQKNLKVHAHHPKVTIGIWEVSKNILTWAIKLVEHQISPFKFYFVKQETKYMVQQMPIHDMA
jgi:hypothetical protein